MNYDKGLSDEKRAEYLHGDTIYHDSRAATDSEILASVLPAFDVIWQTLKKEYRDGDKKFLTPNEYRVSVKGQSEGRTFLLGRAAFIPEEILRDTALLPVVLAYMCGGINTILGNVSLFCRYQWRDCKDFLEPEAFKVQPTPPTFQAVRERSQPFFSPSSRASYTSDRERYRLVKFA